MHETRYTPGPWWIEERGDVISILGPRENCSHNGRNPAWEMAKIDNYVFWDEPETEDEDRANARLICAAPELLEALQLLFESYKSLADSGDAGNWRIEDQPEGKQALAAIERATNGLRNT